MTPASEHYRTGLDLLQRRDHLPEAEAAFRQGLAVAPEHAGCLLQLGITLRVQGRLREAAVMLERARQAAPEDPIVHLQRGTLLRAQGRPEEAMGAYETALAIEPGHPYIRFKRANTLQELNRLAEALASYDQLLDELPAELSEAYHLPEHKAEVLRRLQRIAAGGVDPTLSGQEMAKALYRRANELVLQEADACALVLYEEAAALAPDYADPGFPLGETVAAQRQRHPAGAYPSCRWIEECLYLLPGNTLGFCCTHRPNGKVSPLVGPYHGGPIPIDYVLARRAQLIRENRADLDNACQGCHQLECRAWPAADWLFRVVMCGNHTVCNQNCSYCTLALGHFEMPGYYYMAEPAITSLISKGWLAPDSFVVLGGGEPTVSREFSQNATRLLAHGCRLNVYTNATQAPTILLDALRQGRCDLITSVDSGTPETFYRMKYMSDSPVMVKDRPAFDAVWENIGRYAEASSGTLFVKYIFTLRNISEPDLTGFICQCIAHGVTQVMLSPELDHILADAVPAEIWAAIQQTLTLAHAHGLTVYFHEPFYKTANLPEDLANALRGARRRPAPPYAHSRPTGHDDFLELMEMVASPASKAP
jgi:tetratricopeptide (TPR) repeat protein